MLYKIISVAALALVVGSRAQAGVVNGGGGRSVVCSDSTGKITSATLLDLLEARAQYGLQIDSQEGSEAEITQRMTGKLMELSSPPWRPSEPFAKFISDLRSNFRFLPKGVALEPIDDSHEVLLPTGCEIKQLAIYKENNLILINSDIWEHLDEFNRAALVFHEALYKAMRNNGAKDSTYARKMVAYLFSNSPLEPVFAGLPNRRLSCGDHEGVTPVFSFDIIPNCQGTNCKARFQFFDYDSRMLITKAVVDTDFDYALFTAPSARKTGGWFALRLQSLISSGDELEGYLDFNADSGEFELKLAAATDANPHPSPLIPIECQWTTNGQAEPTLPRGPIILSNPK